MPRLGEHWLDVVVLVVYLASMASLGPLFARRAKTTEGYFLGDRSFPGWLTGTSMFATSISSITFMAYPGDAFKTGWLRMLPNLMLPLGTLVAVYLFLPFFRRGKITSAYEYLETRFGANARTYAATFFIILQVVRISAILYLVSQLVETVTGLPPMMSVFVGGIITSFYTITGGIRAVLWTDFIQAIVLWLGGLLCILIIAMHLGGPFSGLAEIARTGWADGKFAFTEYIQKTGKLHPVPWWSFDLTRKTVLMMLLIGMGDWLTELCGNQNMVQRYCASRSTKDARQALWVSCWFSVPTWALFMFLGTSLYVFYRVHPSPEAAAILTGAGGRKAEQILPLFVTTQMPPGVAGLVIAAVLSAAMSSLSSSINGTSAVILIDIYKRYIAVNRDDRHYVIVSKAVGCALAVIMIVGAAVLLKSKSTTLQDTYRILTALTAGGLFGLFFLGFATKTGDTRSVGIGIVFTVLWTLWSAVSDAHPAWFPAALLSPVDSYYTGLVGHFIMFGLGYGIGRLWPKAHKDLANLTIWTQDESALARDGARPG